MRVLGIDPGYGRCGVAVVEKKDGRENVLHSNCVETSAKDEFSTRLRTVVDMCEKLIRTHKPDAVALEKLYFTKNQKTAMRVAEVRGALLALCAEHNIPVTEYGPGQIKSAVTGSGRADKTHIAKMLHALMKIEKKMEHDDEYDAIAVALTHLAMNGGRATRAIE